MSKEISIGSWAYTIGPYAKAPVDFETVCDKLEELGFNGVELGSFKPHPNPDDLPDGEYFGEVCHAEVPDPEPEPASGGQGAGGQSSTPPAAGASAGGASGAGSGADAEAGAGGQGG